MQPGYHIDSNAGNGLYVTTFTTPQGKIGVNFTDDPAAGDTVSGTVEAQPAGKNDKERAKNKAELDRYVVEIEGQKTPVSAKNITCNIPPTLTPESQTISLLRRGQAVSSAPFPISATPPPAPTELTLPTGGQEGRPIQINGPSSGTFSPTDYVKLGGTTLPPVAKGPRKEVLTNIFDVAGPTEIERKENGLVTKCPFRNIGIQLSAPKLNLLRGETTTLHVVVAGLAGITQDVPLDLQNDSPTVITMSGGQLDQIVVHPADVQRDGTFATDRTLTGIVPGSFGVTGAAHWTDICRRPVPTVARSTVGTPAPAK